MNALRVVSETGAEPLDLAAAKIHLRVDGTDQDTLITSLITAARRQAEHFTRRALVRKTLRLTCDDFPAGALRLNVAPVVSVERVIYASAAGQTQELTGAQLQVDLASEPARVAAAAGACWPQVFDELGAVQVEFTAGYANGEQPADIVAAIRLLLSHLYEHRESVVVGTSAASVPHGFESLLWPYRLFRED